MYIVQGAGGSESQNLAIATSECYLKTLLMYHVLMAASLANMHAIQLH